MPYFQREKVAICGGYFILSVPKEDSFVFFRGNQCLMEFVYTVIIQG